MSRRHDAIATIAAGLIAVGGLVGCSEDGGDEAPDSGLPSRTELSESTPTSPTTETTPASATRPELPDRATEPGRAGARAFVAYYLQLVNYAKDTGDAEPLRRHSHPQCGGCDYFVRYYEDWYEAGGWFEGGDQSIHRFERIVPTAEPHDMYVRVKVDVASGIYKEHEGTKIRHGRKGSSRLEFWLVRGHDEWRVSRLDTPA